MIDFDKIKIRCSALGELMTGLETKGWGMDKSVTAQKYLRKLHRGMQWNRRKDVTSKYMDKGLKEEENSLTLLSLTTRVFFKKNDKRIENDWLSGEPDTYVGESILKAKEGYDVKSSWDWTTFPYPNDELESEYEYQALGYIDLTGADCWNIAHCLVNTPANLILQAKKSLWFSMDCPDEDSTSKDAILYREKCIDIEKNMIVDMVQFQKDNPVFDFHCPEWTFDIPKEERIRIVTVARDDKRIQLIHDRVVAGREWMKRTLTNKIPPIITTKGQEVVSTMIAEGKEQIVLASLPPKDVPAEAKEKAQKKIRSMKKVKVEKSSN